MTLNLTERVGPLPVWAWAGIAVGGIGLGLYERHRIAAQAAPATGTSDALPADTSSAYSTATTDAATFDPDATSGTSSSDPYGVTTTYNVGTLNVSRPTTNTPAPAGTPPASSAPSTVAAAPLVDGEGATLADRINELGHYAEQLGRNEQAVAQADPNNPAMVAAAKGQLAGEAPIRNGIEIIKREIAALTPAGNQAAVAQSAAQLATYEEQAGRNEQAIDQIDPNSPAMVKAGIQQAAGLSSIETGIGIIKSQALAAANAPAPAAPTPAARVASPTARAVKLPSAV